MFPILAFGQGFEGSVRDQLTKEPIPYANIYFPELQVGTTTNSEGIFTLEHYPKKMVDVQISFVGYKTLIATVDLGSVLELEFFLEPSHVQLDEVVVSVPGGKLQRESIVSIESRKMAQIQQNSPTTLAEAITNIPGIEQNSTGVGIGKPVIRGLSGNRIVTYAQGIRIENQQWGAEHGLGVGDVGIESVEVIKGPSSLLYGSDALGGVLYFVDERYAKNNMVEGFFKSKFLSNTIGTMNDLGLKLHKGKVKLNLFGTYNSHADYATPNNDRVFNTRFDEKDFKASVGFMHKNWITNLRYSYLHNDFGITDTARYASDTDRDPQLPFQQIDNHFLSFENTLFTGNSKLNLVLGFTGNERKEFEDSINEPALAMDLTTYTYNLKWYVPLIADKLDLVVGSQGMQQDNTNSGEEILIPDANTRDLGGFAVLDLDLGHVQLQGGIRVDDRAIDTQEMITDEGGFTSISRSYSSINYSGGAVFRLKRTTLRANISSGFRAPNTSELLSNGVHEGTNRYEIGNPDLHSESATQIDLSIERQNEHFEFYLNPFANAITNYIFLSPTDTIIDGSPVFEYLQTNAILFGGETGIHYHPHSVHWLHLEGDLSMVFGEDEQKNALPLIPATKINTKIKVELSQKGKFRLKDVFIQYIYRFEQNRTGLFETTTADYSLLNMGLNMEIATAHQPIEISAGVNNLLSMEYIDHLSRFKPLGIPNQGINFYLGLTLRFERSLKKAKV